MNQRGGLERLARRLLRHLGRGQAAQLIVNERKEFLSSGGIAARHGFENVCDISHGQDASWISYIGNAAAYIPISVSHCISEALSEVVMAFLSLKRGGVKLTISRQHMVSKLQEKEECFSSTCRSDEG
jgi:hypothetical protein